MPDPNLTTADGLVMTNYTLTKPATRYVGHRIRQGEILPDTARNFRAHLHDFAAFYGQRDLDQLSYKTVNRYLGDLRRAGRAPGTIAVRLSTLRGFARWCSLHHVTRTDWTIGTPRVRRPRQVPRDMTNEHAALVYHQARTEREQLLVLLMFGAGLRCIEVHRLNIEDLDRSSKTLFVTGKGGHEREVPLPHVVMSSWDSYLAAAGHHQGALMRSESTGGRLGAERISGLVGHLVRLSGVKIANYDGRSAHGLRAAAASDLFDACLDVRVVQRFLGHANISTTDLYLRRPRTQRIMTAQMARPMRLTLPIRLTVPATADGACDICEGTST